MSIKYWSILAFALVSSSCSAQVQTNENQSFSIADKNHDGRISFDEFEVYVRDYLREKSSFEASGFSMLSHSTQEAVLKDHFDKMDVGHKGYLLPNEWKR
ncbi:EF-hand domain-containing protein [Gluconobacter sp. NFX36]|uniref:EF hand n=2 Tax=Gluconobacter TaxID=441 RepID=A0A1B6VH46_9PROT|nr:MULTISPECIES: EF-hand domain-containing protein [Gluconobacter]KXV23495.1 hypothetical protein AD936_22755 [Gluconobacter japonicus]MBF0871880.1 EF-hand domain-containing protein [Gluconobacter japonicus]OAJ66297.1 EF hand [Gluconobacter cerinus]